jgi:bifunctional oligoribonuclease and PAP phosphatase NrnA
MLNFKDVKTLLSSSKKIAILPHTNPDADALGSCLGLGGYLMKKDHQVSVISPTDYPKFLNWMDGHEGVVVLNEKNFRDIELTLLQADIIFCLDFNSLKRVDSLGPVVAGSRALKILIDHHLEPEDFADFSYASTDAAATAELIYEFIVKLGDRELIDSAIAENLYAGIMTDTGQFKYKNTTQNVHYVTANLMELGCDISKVGSLIYDTNSYNRLKFLGFALSQRLTFLPEYKTAYIAINAYDLRRFNSRTGDTEGLVNYALSLENVVLGVLITEREEGIKLSLRSKGDFSVNEIAKKHFNGGGHRNAAGGSSEVTFEETIKKFENILEEYKEELNAQVNEFTI